MDQIARLRLLAQELSAYVPPKSPSYRALRVYVDKLLETVRQPTDRVDREELRLLVSRIRDLYSQCLGRLVPDRDWRVTGGISRTVAPAIHACVSSVSSLVDELAQMDEATFRALAPAAAAEMSPAAEVAATKPPCVFIGHGRSKLWAELKLHVENDLHIPTTEYESAGRAGLSTIDTLKKMLDTATFAVLILTAEDETADGTRRARQNVVHEAGLFQGRLGFDKAVLMIQDGVEGFSNIHGLQHINFTGDNIEGAFHQLRRALEGAGVL